MSGGLKIGLALGSGGARGLAHVGVLEALEELRMSAEFCGEVGFGKIRNIVLMVVNSHSSPDSFYVQRPIRQN